MPYLCVCLLINSVSFIYLFIAILSHRIPIIIALHLNVYLENTLFCSLSLFLFLGYLCTTFHKYTKKKKKYRCNSLVFSYVIQLYSLWEEGEFSSFTAIVISHYSCLPFYFVCFIYHVFCMFPYLLLDWIGFGSYFNSFMF